MNDDNLIFVISQPRSGSTLIQKILSQHPDIYTRSEPWIMLHPAYSLKKSGILTEYDTAFEKKAFEDFISNIPNGGRSVYLSSIRECYLSLYEKYLNHYEKKYFLDKTPRYYLIYDELKEIFPNAKFILIQRNPLAVLGSISNSWTKEKWERLYYYRNDLIEAIDAILKIKRQPDQLVIMYEDLVSNPEKTLQEICAFIGIDYISDMLKYKKDDNENWKLGDQLFINETNTVDSGRLDKWMNRLEEPQYWRVIYEYLVFIGEEKFNALGYDYKYCLQTLEDIHPISNFEKIRNKTLGLSFLLYLSNDDLKNIKRSSIINHQELRTKLKLYRILNSKKYKMLMMLDKMLVWLFKVFKNTKK